MNLFIAVFEDDENLPGALTGGVSDLIKDALRLSDTVFVIRSPVESPAAMDDVLIGEDRDDYRAALVLKLNGSYSGFQRKEVWEWLEKSAAMQRG